MTLPLTAEPCPSCRHVCAPGADFMIVQNPPVALRDLADQLSITFGALHQQVTAGNVPTIRLSDRRNAPLYVDAEIAAQIRTWHAANRFRPWPKFPLQDA